ncbi:hypothetical protein ABBQ38_013303 [Trebouxia sp. C0009 RCD-2024]
MSGGQSTRLPVPLTVSGDEGYIWDPDGVKWLRQHCRIVGGLTGSTAEQKQHKSAGGLPCKLSAEELALALRQGWVTTVEPPSHPEGPEKSSAGVCLQAPAWLTAVLNKKPVQLPVTSRAQCSAGSEATYPPLAGVVTDTGPDIIGISSNKAAVFSSLHASGYFVTDGSKFGSDYLLYPGDPLFYHAQFTVQVLDHQATVKPALLVGGARGSHSARKHLLLASVYHTSLLLQKEVLGQLDDAQCTRLSFNRCKVLSVYVYRHQELLCSFEHFIMRS